MARRTFTALVVLAALVLSLPAALWLGARIAQEHEREFLRSSEWMARNFADQVWLQLRTLPSDDTNRPHNVFTTMVEEFVVMDPVIYAQIVLDGALVAQHQHLGRYKSRACAGSARGSSAGSPCRAQAAREWAGVS